jgi:cytochrome c peroxidase
VTIRWTILIAAIFFAGAFIITACKKSGSGKGPQPLVLEIPPGFPAPVYAFAGNQLTEEGFQLGRKLFYDGRLSQDGNFPCGSCHMQVVAFATFGHPLSHGFNNSHTLRNAPGLFNLAWLPELHWDGGINHIEVQPLAPLESPTEMAETIPNVISKLQADAEYRRMFKDAFGDELINSQRMLKAITQFVGAMQSANSKYDRMKQGQATYTFEEEQGYTIFKNKCAGCHVEPLFTDNSYRNTGIPVDPALNDYGRMRITGRSEDSLKFRVPSLRNVYATFPYGHDGRFYAVQSMLEHYMDGVQDGTNVDPLVKNKIPLSNVEQFYLKEFLRTLTDSTFLNNPRFAQPPQ